MKRQKGRGNPAFFVFALVVVQFFCSGLGGVVLGGTILGWVRTDGFISGALSFGGCTIGGCTIGGCSAGGLTSGGPAWAVVVAPSSVTASAPAEVARVAKN